MSLKPGARSVRMAMREVGDKWWFDRGDVVSYAGRVWVVWGPALQTECVGTYQLMCLDTDPEYPLCHSGVFGRELKKTGLTIRRIIKRK